MAGFVKKARAKLKRKPELEAELREIWNEVCDALEAHHLATRPKPKTFEVHHANEMARAAFLAAFLKHGLVPVWLKQEALAAIGIEAR